MKVKKARKKKDHFVVGLGCLRLNRMALERKLGKKI